MAKITQDLSLVTEQRLLEAGLRLHNGMMQTDRAGVRQHLRDALDALDVAINEVRLAVIDLDDHAREPRGRLHSREVRLRRDRTP